MEDQKNRGLGVSARSIIFASNKKDYAQAAANATNKLREKINHLLH